MANATNTTSNNKYVQTEKLRLDPQEQSIEENVVPQVSDAIVATKESMIMDQQIKKKQQEAKASKNREKTREQPRRDTKNSGLIQAGPSLDQGQTWAEMGLDNSIWGLRPSIWSKLR